MSPKVKAAKDQFLSLNTLIALVMAALGGTGGTYVGNTTMAYRLEQIEKRQDQSKEADLDKRLTRIEDAQHRTDETLSKLDRVVDRMDKVLARIAPDRPGR